MHMLSEKKWLERMENECRILFREGYEGEVSPNYEKLIIIIRANGFEPPSSGNKMPSKRTTHKVEISVTRDYPPDVPITRWLTPIFHPNIAPPGPPGYGRVCMEMLNIGISTLFELVRGLQVLVENPNPTSPLNYPTCLKAKKFFEKHSGMTRETDGPRIVGFDSDTSTGGGPRIIPESGDECEVM